MDSGHSGKANATGTLPRLSRLPKLLPRTSYDNLRLQGSVQRHDPIKASSLPRPSSRTATSRQTGAVPLGENLNSSVKERYAWSTTPQSKLRSQSPVRDALQATNATLDNTPPGAHAPLIHDDNNTAAADENGIGDNAQQNSLLIGKRKPRLSLSERTVETLSRVSLSPSPTRRRRSSLITTHDGLMGPPARPASRSAQPRSVLTTDRSPSPTKHTSRLCRSPTREPPLPVVASPGAIYTPPRAFVKGGSARNPRAGLNSMKHAPIQADQWKPQDLATGRPPYSSKTERPKAASTISSARAKTTGAAALEALFKEPESIRSETTVVTQARPRVKTIRPALSSNANTADPALRSGVKSVAAMTLPSKSSAALRDTIAQAKAAKRAGKLGVNSTTSSIQTLLPDDAAIGATSGEAVLHKRLESAVVSGNLNLAAFGLSRIPQEVLSMYETTTRSISWSEMVDLTKLNLADNKVEEITDEVLPDWSVEELHNDDEKTNLFGGLELLDLHNNLLKTIPVGMRRLERLKTLNLNGNALSNQALTIIWQIPNIQNLQLANNDLKGAINLSTMATESLRKVDLSGNSLNELELAEGAGKTLQSLDVSSNKLDSLPWSALASCELIELKARSNQLTGVALEGVEGGLQNLVHLDLSHNQIVSLGEAFSGLSALQLCTLSGNKLTKLPDMGALKSLAILQVAENCLDAIPISMHSLMTLRNVDLARNNIKSVQPDIGNMKNLTSLNLAGNPLRERKYLNMTTENMKADMQKRLEPRGNNGGSEQGQLAAETGLKGSMDSSEAHIRLFKVVNGVLDLSNRGLKSVDASTIDFDSQHVHTLRLTNNELTALPEELLCHPALATSLRSLDISHNPHLHSTEYIHSEIHLPTLQYLYVVSTGLTSLDALANLKAPALMELNISCHRLAGALPQIRAWFPNCTTLLASDNWFSSIHVDSVRGLEVLDIRNNQIESLPPAIGLLGNHGSKREEGRLRMLEVAGNVFRVPRIAVVERGTEAVLKDLRRMVPLSDVPEEWQGEV